MAGVRLIIDLPENEYHKYSFEMWQYGYKIGECTYNNLNEARRFYASNGDCINFALKLFIDDELIDFTKMSKYLKISDADKYLLNLAF